METESAPYCPRNSQSDISWMRHFCAFLIPRVREYWDKPDVNPPLIRNRGVGVEAVAICAELARISRFKRHRFSNASPDGRTTTWGVYPEKAPVFGTARLDFF